MTSTRAEALIEEAYNTYADPIFRHCYFRLLDREKAKELMQETFIKTFEYAKKGQPIDNIRALLYRIANNLVVDYVRKNKEASLDHLMEAGFDPTGADDNSVKARLEEERIRETLHKLDPNDRELIVMRYIDDLKPQEIADMMGLTANVVSVRIHRALKELKTILRTA
jgi:RNA polymerase sigma-70 factor (ECF subfamily)